ETVAHGALVVGKDQRLALAGVDMEVEEETSAVVGRERLEAIGGRFWIAVGRMAVGHVQHRRRKRGRMRRAPLLDDVDRRAEPGAHRRLAVALRLEPDGKADRLLDHVAVRAGDLPGAGLDPERSLGETRDDMQRLLGELAGKSIARILA